MIYTCSDKRASLDSGDPVTGAVVESFEEVEGILCATGSLSSFDPYERCGDTNKWEAKQNTEGGWTVTPAKDGVFWLDERGEPMFTLAEHVNKAMVKFISDKLTAIKSLVDDGGRAEDLTDDNLRAYIQ